MTGKILVTGGTGSTGTALAARLQEAGVPFRIATRQPISSQPISSQPISSQPISSADAEQVRFDWEDETTYGPALEGAEKVYLVAPVSAADPELTLSPERVMVPFLRRALDAGVRRAVLLSSSAIPEGGPAFGQVHQAVREMMPEWSVLQPSWFMQNFVNALRPGIQHQGEIVTATGSGKVSFVDVGDIAAVAFHALTDTAPPKGPLILTGPQALSYADAAALISQAAHRPVRHVHVTAAQLQERLQGFGMPAGYAALLTGLDEKIKNGAEDRVTSVVQDITGRPPKSFADFACDNAEAWR